MDGYQPANQPVSTTHTHTHTASAVVGPRESSSSGRRSRYHTNNAPNEMRKIQGQEEKFGRRMKTQRDSQQF